MKTVIKGTGIVCHPQMLSMRSPFANVLSVESVSISSFFSPPLFCSDTDVVDATLKESSRPLPEEFLHPPRSPLRPGSSGGLAGSRPGTAGRRVRGNGSGNEENLSPYKSRPSGVQTSEDSDADRSSLHGFTSPFKVCLHLRVAVQKRFVSWR